MTSPKLKSGICVEKRVKRPLLITNWYCKILLKHLRKTSNQRWSPGHMARGQDQGHKKKSKAKAKNSLSEDRHFRAQGQECPRPRTKVTSASALQKKKGLQKIFQAISKKKKKGLHKNFSGDLQKKKKVFTKAFQAISSKRRFPKNFSSAPLNFNNSKNSAVLEPRTGQFSRTWSLDAKAKNLTFEAKHFKMCPWGRSRGQGRPRGFHLC